MKHGDAAVLCGLGLVILLQTASVVMLIADADPVALPVQAATASTAFTRDQIITSGTLLVTVDDEGHVKRAPVDTTATTSLIGPPETTAPLAVPAVPYYGRDSYTTGPMDRDADGYCPLDVAPLPARLDGTPTTEYALIEVPRGTDQLVIEIQMLERSRGNE